MSNSTTSLVSNTTLSSRAPLNGSAQSKDFRSVLTSLQSTFGFGGTAPSPVPKKPSPQSTPTTSAIYPAADASLAPKATKNFESAFADLQSTYGFSGAAPSPVPKKREDGSLPKPKKRGSGSFFSKFRSSSTTSPSPSTSTPKTKTKTKTKFRAVPRPTQQMIVL
ncbi:hypothetical protein B0H19DRAFT_1251311 [Mycena capillaripes]|nr:hypothetical protein B0H19DRAFT_1251311 [Mycena capillaripes]